MNKIDYTGFFGSSITLDNRFQDLDTFRRWLASRCRPHEFVVEQVPLGALDRWSMDRERGAIVHESGRFFSIQGIGVRIDDDRRWDQPIINQPEIGVLGLLTRVIDGVRYFLVQAKMEPGNVNILQVSPTLQATRSNFTRVHRGKSPAYLEYFDGTRPVRVLVDQLQTEQGARFMRKQNRNMVVEVDDDITVLDDFKWLTLGELKRLLLEDNLINMDTRSVLSTIPLIEDHIADTLNPLDLLNVRHRLSNIGVEYIKSYLSHESYRTTDDVLSWYNRERVIHEMTVTDKPLWDLEGWRVTDDRIVPDDDRFFSVIGVKVRAGNREVSHWMQPLIADEHEGLLAFIVQEINGILHFLIQAKIEPGNRDIVELSPTVSCSNHAHVARLPRRPALFDEVWNPRNQVLLNVVQSEEGGRFYHLRNRNMIVRVPAHRRLDVPDNMMWMSLRQIKEFMRYGLFNIETRSIISGISFID